MQELSNFDSFMVLLAIILGNAITRFLPSLIFSKKKDLPKIIIYIGNTLPFCIIALLIIYSLKDSYSEYFLEQIVAIIAIVISFYTLKSQILSVLGGSAIYMILVQTEILQF